MPYGKLQPFRSDFVVGEFDAVTRLVAIRRV